MPLPSNPSDALSPAQRQTLPARRALAAKFPTPESKSEHFRRLAEKANAGRVVLSGAEAEALVGAYELLRRIAQRAKAAADPPPEKEVTAGGEPAVGEAA